MVTVQLMGRLGNNLFQYAVGRLIAERHGLAMTCEPPVQAATHSEAGEPNPAPALLTELTAFLPRAPLRLDGLDVQSPVERFEMGSGSTWSGMQFDMAGVLANSQPRHIRLAGFFQRYEYFREARDRIREWYTLDGVRPLVEPDGDDVLLNIRRDRGFALREWVLPLSYYERVLNGMSHLGQVYVCGTGIDDDVRARFARYAPIYLDGTPIEHLATFRAFHRIILSNSTFAWWGGFLSEGGELYAPRSGNQRGFAFTGWEDVDLHMREERYREVEVPAFSSVFEVVVTPAAATALSDAGGTMIVQRQDGDGSPVTCATRHRAFAQRLFTMKQPVDVTSLINRPGGLSLALLVDALAYAGLVTVRHRCADPAAV